jgi:transcriptional regulator with XRE-family HTH domain
MSDKSSLPLRPGQVFARRVRERREQLGLTQKQLADRLAYIGCPIDRSTIVKIEKGENRVETRAELVPLRDVFALAVALRTAPVYLLAPLAGEERVAVTPRPYTEFNARTTRDWIRGKVMVSPAFPDTRDSSRYEFLLGLPEDEQRELLEADYTPGRDEITPDEAAKRDAAIDATVEVIRALDRTQGRMAAEETQRQLMVEAQRELKQLEAEKADSSESGESTTKRGKRNG